MRSQNNGVAGKAFEDRGERIKDETFLFEEAGTGEPALEQMAEQVRRRCIGQFLLPIMKTETRQVRYRELVEAQHFKRLRRGIEATFRLVSQEDEERNVRVMLVKRIRQHASQSQVPLRCNRRRD